MAQIISVYTLQKYVICFDHSNFRCLSIYEGRRGKWKTLKTEKLKTEKLKN